MNATSTGWTLFIAAVGMMASLMAGDVAKLAAWDQAVTPTFIASLLAHLGAVIMAFVGGKLIPADRDPLDRTRSGDPQKG